MHPSVTPSWHWPLLSLAIVISCSGEAVVESNPGGSGGTATTSTSSSSSTTSSGAGGFSQCDGPGQCTLEWTYCCSCNQETLSDMVAINANSTGDYYDSLGCGDEPPCPPCVPVNNPDLFAYCEQGLCTGADIKEHPQNTCTDASDCRLRLGLECCECEDPWGDVTAIPISFETELMEQMCHPAQDCADCVPEYPPGMAAFCEQGRCVAGYLPD